MLKSKVDLIIRNASIINRGKIFESDIAIHDKRIALISPSIYLNADTEIDASGLWLMPGIIDDQVHFREPGLTHKANIYTESRAAVAGGVTSFMEMPNTNPPATTQVLLQDKYDIAATSSWCNYSFFMGAANDNLDEVLKTDPKNVCGIKAFMGSSTGNMLVDDPVTLENLFSRCPMLIATHCEDEATIKANLAKYNQKELEELSAASHPIIRDEEACLISSTFAAGLANKYGTRLHILHISTSDELSLFRNDIPLSQKKITSEACVHHLYFTADDYANKGNLIKCNPAIKAAHHAPIILEAVLDDRIDIIATDHAPHTREEKNQAYFKSPSGLPLIQHTLDIMLDLHHQGKISFEKIVEKMCHAPAECFNLAARGFLDEGMYADMVLVDPKEQWSVAKDNIFYKCGWSPLEGKSFKGRVLTTFVNGEIAYHKGEFTKHLEGMRLTFDR
jgi:dihydroorotase